LIVCGLGIGAYFYSGQILKWFAPAPIAAQARTTSTGPANQQATPATATLTLLPPTPVPSPKPTVAYTPHIEDDDCPFDNPDGVEITCAYAILPEDRSVDPTRTIRLMVATYHSPDSNPSPYPVVFLQGGPGAEAVQLSVDAYEVLVAPFLESRDFIVLDQRGTGLSEPALECQELTELYLDDIHGLIPASTRHLVYSNAFISCNGLMRAQGVSLDAFTSSASAADVRDVLSLLGIQKADFYGASYGTRLAQVILRDYPGIVHSLILDSVVPLETNLFLGFEDGIDSALDTLFAGCFADSDCNVAYPQLGTVFWNLVRRLDAEPVTVTTSFLQTGTITETLNGSMFLNVILGLVKQSNLISTAPQTIYRFQNGDYSTLIDAQASLPYIFEGISPGLYISMMCHEHILASSLDELKVAAGQSGAIRDYAWLPFYGGAEDLYKTCQSWGSNGPRLGENDVVTGEIPALVIAGSYDPVTPPGYAQKLAANLSGSYYFEFIDQGHTPTVADASGCAMQIALSFLDDPAREPDRTCLEDVQPVEFVIPYTGTPPYSMKTVQEAGVSLRVPRDWLELDEGIYLRNNSMLDIAQVGILLAPVKPDDLTEYFGSVAAGYLGFDSAPVENGQHRENGLDWTLYAGTSDGRPVDMAVTGLRGRSLVLSLISNLDERQALFDTVFLPMLASAQP